MAAPSEPEAVLEVEVRLPGGTRVVVDGILAAATMHTTFSSTAVLYPRELALVAAIVDAVGAYRSK